MTDYKKLIKELRETAKHLDGISRFPYDDDPAKRIYSKKMADAADAIEALQAEQKKTVTQIFGEEQQKWEEYCAGLMIRIRELKAQMPKRGEIVRCGECKHYNAGFECLVEGYGIERDPDWFCADGEREVQDANK